MTSTSTIEPRPVTELRSRAEHAGRVARAQRTVGLGLLGLPLAVLAFTAVLAGVRGEPGAVARVVQVGLAGLLAVGAWSVPGTGGPILMTVGAVFGAVIFFTEMSVVAKLAAFGLVLAPVFVAGLLFTLAARKPVVPIAR